MTLTISKNMSELNMFVILPTIVHLNGEIYEEESNVITSGGDNVSIEFFLMWARSIHVLYKMYNKLKNIFVKYFNTNMNIDV